LLYKLEYSIFLPLKERKEGRMCLIAEGCGSKQEIESFVTVIENGEVLYTGSQEAAEQLEVHLKEIRGHDRDEKMVLSRGPNEGFQMIFRDDTHEYVDQISFVASGVRQIIYPVQSSHQQNQRVTIEL